MERRQVALTNNPTVTRTQIGNTNPRARHAPEDAKEDSGLTRQQPVHSLGLGPHGSSILTQTAMNQLA